MPKGKNQHVPPLLTSERDNNSLTTKVAVMK